MPASEFWLKALGCDQPVRLDNPPYAQMPLVKWHQPRGRLNVLKRLRLLGDILGMVFSAKGAWAIARNWVMTSALKNETPERYGFTPAVGNGDDGGRPPTQPPDAKTARPVVWKSHGAQSP